ncbi:hypothetical protein Dimus_007446 [Dionaea muscipula]
MKINKSKVKSKLRYKTLIIHVEAEQTFSPTNYILDFFPKEETEYYFQTEHGPTPSCTAMESQRLINLQHNAIQFTNHCPFDSNDHHHHCLHQIQSSDPRFQICGCPLCN